MNNIEKSWNNEYCEKFASQYNDTLVYDENMMEKEIKSILGE